MYWAVCIHISLMMIARMCVLHSLSFNQNYDTFAIVQGLIMRQWYALYVFPYSYSCFIFIYTRRLFDVNKIAFLLFYIQSLVSNYFIHLLHSYELSRYFVGRFDYTKKVVSERWKEPVTLLLLKFRCSIGWKASTNLQLYHYSLLDLLIIQHPKPASLEYGIYLVSFGVRENVPCFFIFVVTRDPFCWCGLAETWAWLSNCISLCYIK